MFHACTYCLGMGTKFGLNFGLTTCSWPHLKPYSYSNYGLGLRPVCGAGCRKFQAKFVFHALTFLYNSCVRFVCSIMPMLCYFFAFSPFCVVYNGSINNLFFTLFCEFSAIQFLLWDCLKHYLLCLVVHHTLSITSWNAITQSITHVNHTRNQARQLCIE